MNNKKLSNKYKISKVFEIELTILAIVLLLSLAYITLFFGSEICNFLNKLQVVRIFLKLIPKILLGIGIVLMIFITVGIFKIILNHIKYKLALRKLPLTDKELDKLNLKTPYDIICFYRDNLKFSLFEAPEGDVFFNKKHEGIFLNKRQKDDIKSIIRDNINKILEENYVSIKESLDKEFSDGLNKSISINHLSDIIFTNIDIPTYINTYKDYTSIICVYHLDSKIILGYDKYNHSFKLYIEIGNI